MKGIILKKGKPMDAVSGGVRFYDDEIGGVFREVELW